MKLYVGALQESLFDILDMDEFKKIPLKIIDKKISAPRQVTFVRHLPSEYNEYKEEIEKDERYRKFIHSKNREEQEKLAEPLIQEFFEKVGLDYETQLSSKGKEQ